ncbi:MAG: XdhC family protein [Acidimicrobiales bacterium]
MTPAAERPIFESLREAVIAGDPVALATVVEVSLDSAGSSSPPEPGPAALPKLGAKLLVRPEGETLGRLGGDELERVVTRDARAELDKGATVTRHYGPRGEARRQDIAVFIESFSPPPHLVLFGAVDFTAALAGAGRMLGYFVTVCDARPTFATKRRFPAAHEVIVDWPDRYLAEHGAELGPRDAICVLTHDTKFDVPAVLAALSTRAGYLGAMGSRRTHDERSARLLEAGADEGELRRRLMSPIGIDIGARTPEETAIAICAEIIAERAGVGTQSLRDSSGPIHQR